jgi:hypothetical protein
LSSKRVEWGSYVSAGPLDKAFEDLEKRFSLWLYKQVGGAAPSGGLGVRAVEEGHVHRSGSGM